MGKWLGSQGSLALIRQLALETEKLELRQKLPRLKMTLCRILIVVVVSKQIIYYKNNWILSNFIIGFLV